MSTQEIAERLVELCRTGDFYTVQNELFAADAVSIEQFATPAFEKETKGMDAIKEKGDKWSSMVEEIKGITVSEPIIAPNSFACTLQINVVMKERGPMDISELCVYEVKDGKIISEAFFM
jgi:hypothetical protein